jgi:hypothetical protein
MQNGFRPLRGRFSKLSAAIAAARRADLSRVDDHRFFVLLRRVRVLNARTEAEIERRRSKALKEVKSRANV